MKLDSNLNLRKQ